MENKRIIQVDEKVPFKLLAPLSIQHMFAMFGASVLVPFMFGINPAVVLFMNGVGTLLFILITKGRAPAYLGSSFAFLAPAGVVISKWGYEYALGGFVVVGFLGCVLALIIYKFGSDWIDVVLPPAAMGPVVALIGLELAGTAASNAKLTEEVIDVRNVIVFLVTLLVAVLGSDSSTWFRPIPRLFVGHSDSDRHHRRICCGACLRHRGFLGCCSCSALFYPEFLHSEV